ncbi:hypothetical protein Bca52824_010726 [Brassica carinata]|uniref:Uncharacterized protein n=1 Tax=Brassica carinata TaxID=52824 RepID=A0A8X8BB45_BRACI|nr:hypothetical protein Bca52824_010726 [Brassica carinata]
MATKCTGDCLNIKSEAVCIQPGTTYASLHKWPVAEVEFVWSISHGGSQRRTSVVNSISCRQVYLRSYPFSRKEDNGDIQEDFDGDDAGDGRNEGKCLGGGERKRTAKKSMTAVKTMLYWAFVGRFVCKYFSCACPTKVNVEE